MQELIIIPPSSYQNRIKECGLSALCKKSRLINFGGSLTIYYNGYENIDINNIMFVKLKECIITHMTRSVVRYKKEQCRLYI